jgi:hypothetical protein
MHRKRIQASRHTEESFLEAAVTLVLCIVAFGAWALVALMLTGG